MRKLFLAGASAVLLAGCSSDPSGPDTDNKLSNVGDTRVVADQDRSSFKVDGGADGGEYVLVPFYADSFFNALPDRNGDQRDSTPKRLNLTVSGEGVEAVAAPTVASFSPGFDQPLRSTGASGALDTFRPDFAFHKTLREIGARELRRRGAAGREAQMRLASAAQRSVALAVPRVGDILRLNANANDPCAAPDLRAGRVVAVSERAVVVADSANPLGGFTDADYARFGAMFDTVVHRAVNRYFGDASDIDDNGGRSIIFYTKAVNDLTPANSQSYVGGFFFPRDLFPKTATRDLQACASSNVAEMFYMLVPDPARAALSTNSPFSRERASRLTVGVLAHEYQHLINYSRRIALAAAEEEAVWLNEGLSHVAEEATFYQVTSLAPRNNIGITQLRASQARIDAFNDYQGSNFGRLDVYIRNPETNSPYAADDSLATRGATWQFLRYAADRKGGDEAATFRALVNTKQFGFANIRAVIGEDALTLMRDWTVAQFADDTPAGTGEKYRHPSWNYRSLFGAFERNAGAFPLKIRSLTSTAPVALTLGGGGTAYVRFRVAPNASGMVRLATQGGGALPSTLRVTVLRTK